jgi:hypothetical protein
MSDRFVYKCPSCGTENRLHDVGCEYEHEELRQFEKCYIDILSILSSHAAMMEIHDAPVHIAEDMLRKRVERLHENNPWLREHQDCLDRLITERHIVREDRGLRLTDPNERNEEIIPTFDPIQTIYEHGPVDGCKDYAVYTMVSWCTLKELSWEQTVNFCTEWLRETNAWSRESWGESSISELLDDKRHVWRKDMGWGDYADVAKKEIDKSSVSAQIHVSEKLGLDPEDYDS